MPLWKVEHCAADVVIDKSSQDWVALARKSAPDGYHAVFDANGVATMQTSYDILARNGRLVTDAACRVQRCSRVL